MFAYFSHWNAGTVPKEDAEKAYPSSYADAIIQPHLFAMLKANDDRLKGNSKSKKGLYMQKLSEQIKGKYVECYTAAMKSIKTDKRFLKVLKDIPDFGTAYKNGKVQDNTIRQWFGDCCAIEEYEKTFEGTESVLKHLRLKKYANEKAMKVAEDYWKKISKGPIAMLKKPDTYKQLKGNEDGKNAPKVIGLPIWNYISIAEGTWEPYAKDVFSAKFIQNKGDPWKAWTQTVKEIMTYYKSSFELASSKYNLPGQQLFEIFLNAVFTEIGKTDEGKKYANVKDENQKGNGKKKPVNDPGGQEHKEAGIEYEDYYDELGAQESAAYGHYGAYLTYNHDRVNQFDDGFQVNGYNHIPGHYDPNRVYALDSSQYALQQNYELEIAGLCLMVFSLFVILCICIALGMAVGCIVASKYRKGRKDDAEVVYARARDDVSDQC